MFCPKCGKQLPDGTKFCGGCGAALNAAPAAPVNPVRPAESTNPVPPAANPVPPVRPAAPVAEAPKANPIDEIKKAAKKVPSKYVKIGAIALAAVVVLVVLISVFASGSSEPEFALYMKDDQVNYSDYSKKAPYEITSKLDEGLYTSYVGDTVYLTKDGKTIFYMDKLDSAGEGTLYYNSTSKLTKEATKIEAGVACYHVSENGKLVTYLKGEKLYQYDMKTSEQIAKDVSTLLCVSDDGKTVYYSHYEDGETTYYTYSAKYGEEKIASDVSIQYLTEDYSTIYYLDDGTLYSKAIGKDKEKLLKDVYTTFGHSDDGSFYYIVSDDEETTMMSYFKADDNYADWMERLSGWEGPSFSTLGYYDGKAETVISEGVVSYSGASYEDGYVIYYTAYETAELGGLSLAKLDETYATGEYGGRYDAAYSMVEKEMGDASSNVCINGTVSTLEVEELANMYVSQDGKTMYLISEVEDNEGVLLQADISKDAVKNVEEVDDDVYYYNVDSMFFAYDNEGKKTNTFIYFKDVKNGEGEMFVDGESVEDDVYAYDAYVRMNTAEDTLLFLVDYSDDYDRGTLMTWNGKKTEEICDEIRSFTIGENGNVLIRYEYDDGEFSLALLDGKKFVEIADEVYSATFALDGSVLYLAEYSTSKYEGELYHFNGKKSVLVDEDVTAILTITTEVGICGYYY